MSLVAVLSAAVAVALLMTRPGRPASWRSSGIRVPADAMAGRAVLGAAIVAGAVLAVLARGSLLVLGLIVMAAVLGAWRLVASAGRRKQAERREERVLETCETLVGELRAGQPPFAALASCVEAWPEFGPVATAARLGADVPDALRALGRRAGARGLCDIAGAWQVSHGSGAGLAMAMAQVAESARQSQTTRRLVGSELASARATARLVAGLPLVALLMGSGIGGDPWRFLLGTPIGLGCLGSGLAFGFAGLFWIDRISTAVQSR